MSNCTGPSLTDHDFTGRGERQLTFNPGLVIHAGQSLTMGATNMTANVLATGYIVPSSAVPPATELAQVTNAPRR